jgi:dTDP-3-amino-3,4,6-trideoxy-alpha-D-glucose transaminase
MPIPLFDIHTPLAPLRERLLEAMTRTLDGGSFILGPEVDAFEREFARYLGVEHVIGVANGTDALTIALRAMGVGPGDDVIVPSFTSTPPPRRFPQPAPVRCSATSTPKR